jgi:hypothetical protein
MPFTVFETRHGETELVHTSMLESCSRVLAELLGSGCCE